jgi:hypothetical protein
MVKKIKKSRKNTRTTRSKKVFGKGELDSYGLVKYSEKKSRKSSLKTTGMPDMDAYSNLGMPTRKNINMI